MNDLIISGNKKELQVVLNKDETDKCHLLSVFMENYNKKKNSYIRKKKKKISLNFKDLYNYKLTGKTNNEMIQKMSIYEPELLRLILDVHGIYDLKTIMSKSIPISFLLSTLSVLIYFYIFANTVAGVFLAFYLGGFATLFLLTTGIKSQFVNKRKYKKIFNVNLNSVEAEDLIALKFNRINFLKEKELNLLKKIIKRKDFIEVLKKKGTVINYSDILPMVKREYSEIVEKIENYHLDVLYEDI